jgi:hypothetical protein
MTDLFFVRLESRMSVEWRRGGKRSRPPLTSDRFCGARTFQLFIVNFHIEIIGNQTSNKIATLIFHTYQSN